MIMKDVFFDHLLSGDCFQIAHHLTFRLEHSLRQFATLSVGDNIIIQHNNKNYEIEILVIEICYIILMLRYYFLYNSICQIIYNPSFQLHIGRHHHHSNKRRTRLATDDHYYSIHQIIIYSSNNYLFIR